MSLKSFKWSIAIFAPLIVIMVSKFTYLQKKFISIILQD
jgi:hypothetical protein